MPNTLEITVSVTAINEIVELNFETYGVEDQVDQLLFFAAQNEFGEEFEDVNITSGGFDAIEMWSDDGDEIDPTSYNISERVASMLKAIDFAQVDCNIE